MTKAREVIARAICCQHGTSPDETGPQQRHAILQDGIDTIISDHMGPLWTMWLDDADAALVALTDAGYVIVPKEPTEEMIEATARLYFGVKESVIDIYKAMLAAASQEDE